MSEHQDLGLEPAPADEAVGRRLNDHRPVPAAGFRGALARHLRARDPGYGPRPPRLRLTVVGYTAAGLAAMGVGALVATGAL
jgi:hypothetical protein